MSTIVILGNHGKTTLAYFLAEILAVNSKRVMLIDTNMTRPNMGYVMPIEKKNIKSIGRILSLAIIDKKSILENMTTMKNENIGLLCYAENESKFSYPQIQQHSIHDMFDAVNSLVDYVIVTTQTNINEIDSFILEQIESRKDIQTFCITSADLKGLCYREHLKYAAVQILVATSKHNPYEDILHTFKENVRYQIPYFDNLQLLYNGALLEDADCPAKYRKILDKLQKEEVQKEELQKEELQKEEVQKEEVQEKIKTKIKKEDAINE